MDLIQLKTPNMQSYPFPIQSQKILSQFELLKAEEEDLLYKTAKGLNFAYQCRPRAHTKAEYRQLGEHSTSEFLTIFSGSVTNLPC